MICVGFDASTQPTRLLRVGMDLIAQIASDEVLDAAFAWLCERRKHHHYNSDVWQVRRWWDEKKALVQAQLLAGTYR
jgi:hypothetical protein